MTQSLGMTCSVANESSTDAPHRARTAPLANASDVHDFAVSKGIRKRRRASAERDESGSPTKRTRRNDVSPDHLTRHTVPETDLSSNVDPDFTDSSAFRFRGALASTSVTSKHPWQIFWTRLTISAGTE